MKNIFVILSLVFICGSAWAQPAAYESPEQMPVLEISKIQINGVLPVSGANKQALIDAFGMPDAVQPIEADADCGLPTDDNMDPAQAQYYVYGKTQFIVDADGNVTLYKLDLSSGRFFLETSDQQVFNQQTDWSQMQTLYPSIGVFQTRDHGPLGWAAGFRVSPCIGCDGSVFLFGFDQEQKLVQFLYWGTC